MIKDRLAMKDAKTEKLAMRQVASTHPGLSNPRLINPRLADLPNGRAKIH